MKIAYRLVLVLLIGIFFFGCGGKKSGLEGKVFDGQGQPISGLKVSAKQVLPVKGYEQFDTTTGSDGIFRFPGVMPASEYVISLSTDKWKTRVTMKVTSGTEGQTLVLNTPMVVRFNVMRDGSVIDTKTGLQWLIYSGTDLSAENVLNNVKNIREGGFTDWRLPTIPELASLQEKAQTTIAFLSEIDTTHEACCAWTGEPNSENIEWSFYVDDGNDLWASSTIPANDRIVVVRIAGGMPTASIPPVVTPLPSNVPAPAPPPPPTPSRPVVAEKKEAPAPPPAKVSEKKEAAAPVKAPAAKKKEEAAPAKEPVAKKKESIAPKPAAVKKEPVKKAPAAVKEEPAATPAPAAAKEEPAAKPAPAPAEKAAPAPIGNNISLYFAVRSVSLSAENLVKLKAFYANIKDTPGRLVIEGHSDSTGSSSGKLKISIDRALSVLDTLKKLGLGDKIVVEIKGMGSAKPAGENDTAEGRKLNRRVELTFIP